MKSDLIRLLFSCFLLAGLLSGCASTGDLDKVSRDFNQKMIITDQRVSTLDEKLAAVKAEQENTQIEMLKDRKNNDAIFGALRKDQADGGADITALKDQIQQLRGQIEDLRKELSASTARMNQRADENRDKIDNVFFKVNFIENFLDIGKKSDPAEKTEKGGKTNGGSKDAVKGKTDKESLYAEAYEAFKEGKYEKARADFLNFLKQFPSTEHSDDAQFWIGESYYFEKKYEKAILEYEKVVKGYPDGDKVSYALMKQGLSFLNLGDKASARLLLQQVIKDFPNTNQARIARENLLQIK